MAYEIEKELRYIREQMRSQPAIHAMVEQSLETLKALEYSKDKIEALRKEFAKPIEERKPYEVAPLPPELIKFREDLIAEVESKINEVIPIVQDSVKARVMAEKIVDMASLKYSPEEIGKITRYAKMLTGRATSQYKKLAPELAKPPKPPKVPRIKALEKEVERLRKQVKSLKKKLGEE